MSICQVVDEIKLVYCPAHKGMLDSETADSLAKLASKKAKHLPQRPEISLAEISKANKHLTFQRWQRRWENLKYHKYKQMVPQINSVDLKQRSLQLRHKSRRESSKILQLKSGHCILNTHKSKIYHETKPNYETCQAKETADTLSP